MFYRTAFKWFTITVIAIVVFLIVLLFLGYLLKENEVKTTQLKTQLEQERHQQQAKEQRQNSPFSHLPSTLTTLEKSQQQIIADNLSCQTDQQCFLVQTQSQALGCFVVVNTTGAAILLKIASQNENSQAASEYCQLEHTKQPSLVAQCRNNACSF